jgi:hypothetical protein
MSIDTSRDDLVRLSVREISGKAAGERFAVLPFGQWFILV